MSDVGEDILMAQQLQVMAAGGCEAWQIQHGSQCLSRQTFRDRTQTLSEIRLCLRLEQPEQP